MRKRSPVLTEQELEIMKIVWHRGEVTVREVYEELLERRKVAYTTVMTMLGVLEGKGHVEKAVGERAYVYRASVPKEDVLAGMVADFVARAYNGSASELVTYLIESGSLTPEELDEVAKALKSERAKLKKSKRAPVNGARETSDEETPA